MYETGAPDAASSVTSLTLLEQLKAREPDSWIRFCRVYGPLIYGWARYAGLQPSDAADVCQEVFLVVAGRIAEFRRVQDRNFRNWLWTIAHTIIQAHFRKTADRPVASGGTSANLRWSQVADLEPSVFSECEQTDKAAILWRVLKVLREEVSDSAWRAFWRMTVDGEPANTVAAELGLTNWAVYKSNARLLHRVRQELEGIVSWQDLLRVRGKDTLSGPVL
jgi:RNA polymerase sigma-70 factor (ECF subfamily)